MTWLWVILIVAGIGGFIPYLNSGNSEDAVAGAFTAGAGCAYLIFQIFLGILGIVILFRVGAWLFS